MNGYKNWQTFKFKGKRFLALDTGHNTSIYGDGFDNYGSYLSADSFKEMYAREGELLNLDREEAK